MYTVEVIKSIKWSVSSVLCYSVRFPVYSTYSMYVIIPVDNHQLVFDSQRHRGMSSCDLVNANQRFEWRAQRLEHRSKPPKFRLCRIQ